MKKNVMLTDTTLRDGEQSPGVVISPDDKIRLMQLMEAAGIYQMDAGIPAMGSREKDTLTQMMSLRKRIKISTWNRMNPKDIASAMEVKPDVIHISIPASDRLIQGVLNKDRDYVVRTAKACTVMARDKGYEVTIGFQDASRADAGFMILLANCLHQLGVTMVKLADTVGIFTPLSVRQLIQQMKQNSFVPLGIHTHNDLGMAVPIALEAIKAGVTHVDTTCFGIGERAGNCDLFSLVSNGMPVFGSKPGLRNLSHLQKQAANILFTQTLGEIWNCTHM